MYGERKGTTARPWPQRLRRVIVMRGSGDDMLPSPCAPVTVWGGVTRSPPLSSLGIACPTVWNPFRFGPGIRKPRTGLWRPHVCSRRGRLVGWRATSPDARATAPPSGQPFRARAPFLGQARIFRLCSTQKRRPSAARWGRSRRCGAQGVVPRCADDGIC